MDDDVIDLLKAHEYFRGISGAILGEIASFAKVTNYDAAAVIHQLNDPLTSISFILRVGSKPCADSRGDEQLFQIFERGEQYGIMLGGLGESIPVRIFALEPSTILSLDHEKSMELMLLPDLRRQWLQTYARSLEAVFLSPPPRGAEVACDAPRIPGDAKPRSGDHRAPARMGKRSPFSATRSPGGRYPMWGSVRCWTATDSSRWQIRRQIAEWTQAKRIVVDVTAAQNLDWAVLLRPADCALVFIRPREISSAIERLRALDLASQGWRDKIAIVWLLEEGSSVAPVVPELHDFASREFKICASPLPHPWGKVHSTSMERLVHYLRGVRIGIALGGGAAMRRAPGCAQRPRSAWHRRRCDRRHERRGHDRGPVCRGSGLRVSNQPVRSRSGNPVDLPSASNGGYWYLLYKYRRGQFDPMVRKYLHDWKLEQLAVPCLTVTADLVAGHAVVRDRGDAAHAVLESLNLPMLSAPICRNGQALIDGGVVNTRGCAYGSGLQLRDRRERDGQDRKAAVWRQQAGHAHDQHAHSVKPANVAPHPGSAECQPQRHRRATGEVVIEPEVIDFDLSEFMRAKELFAVGEQAALVQIPKIRQLLVRLDPALFRLGQ